MDAFLSTPELLEALFLECDMRDVLTSTQRVCKLWHEIVNTSPSVQVHLFFRPARMSGARPAVLTSPSDGAVKQRLLSTASTTASEASASSDDTTISSSSTPRSSVSTSSTSSAESDKYMPLRPVISSSPLLPVPNPLLARLFSPFFQPLPDALAQQTYNGRATIESLPLAQLPDAFLHVDASWRCMLVQQPPCESMGVSMPETGYSVLYSRRYQQRRAKEKEERRMRDHMQQKQQQQQQGANVLDTTQQSLSIAESLPSALSTRAEGKCNSTGSCIHGRLKPSRQSSVSGLDLIGTAKRTKDVTPAPEEHDGLIRMWDLYDAVVRGLADPGLRWMVLWRPSVPSSTSARQDVCGLGTMDDKDGRDLEAEEHELNLAAWKVSHLPGTNNHNNIWDPATIHDLLDATTNENNNDSNSNNGPLPFPASSGREDLLGGCTTELMKRGAELIVVRRRDISEGAFMGWSHFRHFQGRYVNPRWLAAGMGGSSSSGSGGGGAVGGNASLERIGGSGRIVVTGAPTRSHRREL